MVTGLVYSEKYLDHNLGDGHPESPARLQSIVGALKEANLWETTSTRVIEPSPTTPKTITMVHDEEYVELLENLSETGAPIDMDTPTHGRSYELALLAAGGTIDAGKGVAMGKLSNAFALVRPPGHHASRSTGGGFCYFNNIAIMSKVLQSDHKINKIMILDFDAHHGNGTQDIFYEDPSVLYMSIHQDGHTIYPGTGFPEEIGAGNGAGYNVNVAIPPASSDEIYASIMHEIFVPLSEEFKPDFIAVSAGFDAYLEDMLTMLGVSVPAYGWMAQFVKNQADKLCDGRTVFVLEGGYDMMGLGKSVVGIVKVLTGEKVKLPKKPETAPPVKQIKEVLSEYWKF